LPTSSPESLGTSFPNRNRPPTAKEQHAVVVDISPAGIPIVGFTGILSTHGHANDPAVADAAICDALNP
jgi:hypothetical protein